MLRAWQKRNGVLQPKLQTAKKELQLNKETLEN
jgi:hypothetical protein